jgi:asparagine synthase (glutamine-hydrolysing)
VCGIAGVIKVGSPGIRTREMLALLRHRGPDDEGLAVVGAAAIGVRRLSIIDLAHGHQPMTNEDGSITVVQNGEIYNYEELRGRLAHRGHRFETNSDTEVLPHLYEEHGESFAAELRGMFAIAVIDAANDRLVLARDRVGKKPLHYARMGEGIAFASEILPLLAIGVDRAVDDDALSDYLALGYVPAPASAFRAIQKLRPAHVLAFERGRVRESEYWRLEFSPKLDVSEQDALELLGAKLDEAVRLRRISDVPLGVFLSGGIDSSAIAAVMAKQGGVVRTYSIGFGDAAFDELRYARLVAEHLGTDHHEYVIEPAAAEVLPELVTHFGEPFADASAVPTYYVARTARRDVTVALNGDGGDELFAGYPRYWGALLADQLGMLPGPLRTAVAGLARATPHHWLHGRLRNARQFAITLGMSPGARYRRWAGLFPDGSPIRGPRLAGRSDPGVAAFAAILADARPTDRLDELLAIDVRMYLAGDLLTKVDIASMAASLEARSPFLDHELMSLVARLPSALKLRGRTSKYLLRRLMTGLLPAETLSRGKMGFGLPVGAWVRGPLRPMVLESIAGASRDGYVDGPEARRLFDEHLAGRADNGLLLWSILALDLWSRHVATAPIARPQLTEAVGTQ